MSEIQLVKSSSDKILLHTLFIMLYRYSTLGKLNSFDRLGGAVDHVDLAEEKEQHDGDHVALVRLTNRDRGN